MKFIVFITIMLTLFFQNASCSAFQQGPCVSSILQPYTLKRFSHVASANDTQHHLKRGHIHRDYNANNIQIPFRGGGTSLHMTDPNVMGTVFNNGPLQLSSIIFASVNLLGFIISMLTGSHLHLDLLGTGSFAAASLPALTSSAPLRVLVSSGAVTLWGSKLASFLFFRALKVKTDARLEDTLSTVGGTGSFWFISLLWGLLCSLPHTLGTTSSSPGSPITLAVGVILYFLGLATETKADYQKWIFKQNNPGKFCNEGLWSISQHPNFFGNLLLWFGIFVMNVDSLVESAGENSGISSALVGSWRAWTALLSPAFMWTLFNGQATGSITNSLELANQKYGSDSAYNSYIKSVPLIVPQIFDWLKKLFT